MTRTNLNVLLTLVFAFGPTFGGCEDDEPSDGDADGDVDSDVDSDADGDTDGDRDPETVPDFAAATFSDPTTIDHPFFPLVPGTTNTSLGVFEDGAEITVVEVLAETREVAGVECVVIRDRVFVDDLLIQDTHDWYAQDDDGNVWYLGEEVDNYNYDEDTGDLIDVTHEGSWEAGADIDDLGSVATAGVVMPAAPTAGASYRQEYYETAAEDMAFVVELDVTVELADGTIHEHCVQTLDWVPLDPSAFEYKFYAPGVGLVLELGLGSDEDVQLVSIETP